MNPVNGENKSDYCSFFYLVITLYNSMICNLPSWMFIKTLSRLNSFVYPTLTDSNVLCIESKYFLCESNTTGTDTRHPPQNLRKIKRVGGR